MELLFSYGTLQLEKTQLSLFGRKLNGYADQLPQYKVIPFEIRDPEFLAKGENKDQCIAFFTGSDSDLIEGTVFEISEEELIHADQYEPSDYHRVLARLASGKNAWVYAGTGEFANP